MPTPGAARHERIPRRGQAVALALLLVACGAGCATYSEQLAATRAAVSAGDYPGAIGHLNDALGVDSQEEVPSRWKGDRSLAVLERGSLLQAVEQFRLSSRDFSAGETELELLELELDPVGRIGKFVYSDSAANYTIPPTERMSVNAMNMVNYLAVGDLSGAAVEARRFTAVRDYLETLGIASRGTFGSYFAGFTFERRGEGDRALRYYEEALQDRPLESLREPVSRLAEHHPYRGPAIEKILAESAPARGGRPPTEIVTVLCLGRVPYKRPERIPVGAAIGLAGAYVTGDADILAYSALKVVVYPELVDSGSVARTGQVDIDGASVPPELVTDLGGDIRAEYQLLKPRIIAAALTRMIARAGVAEGARAAGKQAGGAGELVGLLAALAVEGTMVGLDKPDTRSWSFLADRILVSRHTVAPGDHRVGVRITGPSLDVRREVDVSVPAGGFAVVLVSELR